MFPTREHIEAAQYAADYWKAKAGVYVWPSVTLAQALIESAGWTKLSGKNNGFGIKASAAQIAAGNASYVWTKEERNGVLVSEQHYFADFPSLSDAYVDHGRLLATLKPYRAAQRATDAISFLDGLGAYATASNYRATIRSVMDRLKLQQYDVPGERPAPAPSKPLNPAIIPSASAAAGGVIVAAAPHLSIPNFGVFVAFILVAAFVAVCAAVQHHKQSAANLAAVAAKPDPEVTVLLDQIAPKPAPAAPPAPVVAPAPVPVLAEP